MKIPRIEAQAVKLSTDSSNNRIARDEFTNQGQNISTIGRALQDAGAQIEKVGSLNEKLAADNHLSKRLADIQTQAAQDPDVSPTRQTYYEQEIARAKREAADKISIPLNRNVFSQESEMPAYMAGLKVKDYMRRRTVDNTRAEFVQYSEQAKQQFIQTGDPREREMIVSMRDARMKELVDSGVMSAEGAAETKVQQDRIWREAQVRYEMEQDPAYAIAELQKGKSGVYANIPDEQRAGYMKEAQQLERRYAAQQEKQLAVARNAKEVELVDKEFNKQLSTGEVIDAMKDGMISRAFGQSMIRKLTSPQAVKAVTDMPTYLELVDKVLDEGRVPSEVRKDLLDAQASGKLSDNDFRQLYAYRMGQPASLAEDYAYEQAQKKSKEEMQVAGDKAKIAKAQQTPTMRAISVAVKVLTAPVGPMAGELVMRFLNRVSPESSVQEVQSAAKEIVKEHARDLAPAVSILDDVPHGTISANGRVNPIYSGDTELKGDTAVNEELLNDQEWEEGDDFEYAGKTYVVVDFDADGKPLFEEQ